MLSRLLSSRSFWTGLFLTAIGVWIARAILPLAPAPSDVLGLPKLLQILFVFSYLGIGLSLAWATVPVHELGHLASALLFGGRVRYVKIWGISWEWNRTLQRGQWHTWGDEPFSGQVSADFPPTRTSLAFRARRLVHVSAGFLLQVPAVLALSGLVPPDHREWVLASAALIITVFNLERNSDFHWFFRLLFHTGTAASLRQTEATGWAEYDGWQLRRLREGRKKGG